MEPLLLIRVPHPQGPILRCQGNLALVTAESLRRELGFLAAGSHSLLTLNLTGLTGLDIHGAALLLAAAHSMSAAGGALALVAADGPVRQALRDLGIDRVLRVYSSEQEALEARRAGDGRHATGEAGGAPTAPPDPGGPSPAPGANGPRASEPASELCPDQACSPGTDPPAPSAV